MTRGTRFVVAGLAVAVNAAALAAVHTAMGQINERERLALHDPSRVVVVGQRPVDVAIQHCPAPAQKVL
jgi:hypothetical protein